MRILNSINTSLQKTKKKLTVAKANVINNISGKNEVMMSIDDIKLNPERKALYAQRSDMVERILENLERTGFDYGFPLQIDQHSILLDGYSRYEAIRIYNRMHPDNPILIVPVHIRNIEDEDEALDTMISIQTDRRQIDDGFLFASFRKVDSKKESLKMQGESTDKYSDAVLAKKFNVCERIIQKMRYVLRYGTSEQVQQIEDNKLGINEAYVAIQRQLKKNKPAPTKPSKADSAHTAVPASSTASAEASSELPPKPAKDTENTLLKLTRFAVVNHLPNQDIADYPDKILYAARVNWSNIDADGCLIDAASADCCELNQLVAHQ